MLIPTPRYLALPLIALAIILSLPKQDAARADAVPTVQRAVTDCGSRLGLPTCALASNFSQKVVR